MKNLFLFTALVVMTLSAFNVNAQSVAQNAFDETGGVRTFKKVHTFLRNSQGATVADGEVVCLDVTDDNGAGAFNYCTALGDPIIGVVDEPNGCLSGAICRVLQEGYKANVVFDGSGDDGAAGMALYGDNNGKAAGITSPAASDYAAGTFLDLAQDSSSVRAYIHL